MNHTTADEAFAREFCVRLRPRFEGCNVGTWIGFKHILYLGEEAVVAYMRAHGLGSSRLLADCGLSLEVVDMKLRLKSGIRVDDEIEATLVRVDGPADGPLSFKLQMVHDSAAGGKVVVASGTVAAVLCKLHNDFGQPVTIPAIAAPLVRPQIDAALGSALAPIMIPAGCHDADVGKLLQRSDRSSYVWQRSIPYFYCHDSYRLQYSGFVRIMEEVVERFLAHKGISIRTMLDSRQWIPVVTDARIRLLTDAKLEETLYTLYEVEDVIKDMIYSAAMRCYVRRGHQLVPVAEGRISHAYVHITEREVGTQIASFDAAVRQALHAP
jgi:acyl-CoA thioesterase FadM